MATQVTYIWHWELAELTQQLVTTDWTELTCVPADELDVTIPGDIFVAESSVRFTQNETPVAHLWEIVRGVRERLNRHVPIVIVWTPGNARIASELTWVKQVSIARNRKDLPGVIRELLQPTT